MVIENPIGFAMAVQKSYSVRKIAVSVAANQKVMLKMHRQALVIDQNVPTIGSAVHAESKFLVRRHHVLSAKQIKVTRKMHHLMMEMHRLPVAVVHPIGSAASVV